MFSLLIQGLILPNPSLTLTDADLGSVASQAGSGHFRKNSNSLHVGTAGFQTTLLNVTGSLVVDVTTVFQCIGGIFKILLNIPRLGSSQQVDTAVSDSATSNKEQDFFFSLLRRWNVLVDFPAVSKRKRANANLSRKSKEIHRVV